MIKRYRHGGYKGHRIHNHNRLIRPMRGMWTLDARTVADTFNGHGGHISRRRGSWFLDFMRYCDYDGREHDPLRWAGAEMLSPQRRNGAPLLAPLSSDVEGWPCWNEW